MKFTLLCVQCACSTLNAVDWRPEGGGAEWKGKCEGEIGRANGKWHANCFKLLFSFDSKREQEFRATACERVECQLQIDM